MSTQEEQPQTREPTDIELAIVKHASRLSNIKHIDAKDLALNYLFPLLSTLARETGDHASYLVDLADDVQSLAEDAAGSREVEILENTKLVILKLASLLDETMVASGFYTATPEGLQPTAKIPDELKQKYIDIGPEVVQIASDIEAVLEGFETADDEDEDEDEDEDGDEDAPDAPNDTVVAIAQTPESEKSGASNVA